MVLVMCQLQKMQGKPHNASLLPGNFHLGQAFPESSPGCYCLGLSSGPGAFSCSLLKSSLS